MAAASPDSRLNLLMTDGTGIAATAWGDSLWYLADTVHPAETGHPADTARPADTAAQRIVVASEPYDDDPRWCEVPDRTLLTTHGTRVVLTPLKEISQ